MWAHDASGHTACTSGSPRASSETAFGVPEVSARNSPLTVPIKTSMAVSPSPDETPRRRPSKGLTAAPSRRGGVQVAGHESTGLASEHGLVRRAVRHREGTAGMEATATGWGERARHLAGQHAVRTWRIEVDGQGRREERSRVRVLRLEGYRVGVAPLHDLPEIHHGDGVADVGDGGRIVGAE